MPSRNPRRPISTTFATRPAALGFTLYANDNDRALDLSRRFWGGIQRAGDLPPLIAPGIDTIDITAIGSSLLSLNHSEYADNPALLTDIAQIFQSHLRPPSKRSTHKAGRHPTRHLLAVRPPMTQHAQL